VNLSGNILFLLTCAYIILLPLIPQEIKIRGVTFNDFILIVIFFLYIVNLVLSKVNREKFLKALVDFFTDKLSIFMSILLAVMLLSTFYAVDKKIALSEGARFITYIFLYFLIKYEFNSKKQINILLRGYIGMSFVVSCIGIVQHFTGFALGEQFIKVYELSGNIKITSTLSHPNTYGAYLILIIFPLIMLSIYEKSKIKKIFYIMFSILVFINLLMTFSRNALLGFAIGAVVLTLIYSIKLIFVLGGVGVVTLFIPSVFLRVKDIADLSQNESRIKLWKTALMMIKEHPILGVGNGNFVTQYDTYIVKYRLDYNSYTHYPTHNSYLKVQSELGIVGIASFLGVIVTTIVRVKKLYTSTADDFHKAFYMGVMSSMIAFLFMNFSDNLFFVPKATTYFWFLLATTEALLNQPSKNIFIK
jgi:putative inorganic carbon (HCO3(-)) transporter